MADGILQPDLFGGESLVVHGSRSWIQDFKVSKQYRKATGKENCGNCKYSFRRDRYRKCEFLGDTCSPNTDVSMRKVCNAYEKRIS